MADHNYTPAILRLPVSNTRYTCTEVGANVCARRRGECSGSATNLDGYVHLKGWLPPQYEYHVCNLEQVPSSTDHIGFDATIRIKNITTVDQAQQWVKAAKRSSGVMWRVDVTRPRLGKRVLHKVSYKCQHNVNVKSKTANSRRSSKNTNCQAKMSVTLKHCNNGKINQSKDPHLPDFPFEVKIQNKHNHNLFVAEALRHRDVGEKAIESLTKLFEIGHSPSSALSALKNDLQMEYGDRYTYASTNREICPDLSFVQKLYQKVCRKQYGAHTQEAGATHNQQHLQTDLTADQGSTYAQPIIEDHNDETSHEMPADLVEVMIDRLCQLRDDNHFSPGLVAMAKQFNHIKDNPAKLLSAMHGFGKSTNPVAYSAKAIRRPAKRLQPTSLDKCSVKVGIKEAFES
ncbi:uncharacterized protein si:dkey-75a21.2 isoform X1 [Brienomyrus brachyistius]|uniref:uncharacterized protein si:dkey-75a21.2 isoform X1 n=1 Tax=Brienomyrus brachyistius TaxID=42636 RepID=UPI0020B18454|nr:uncharacterized protein si:dkey-75a21.2 isoform X1 [Brienomyrus brachyistius]